MAGAVDVDSSDEAELSATATLAVGPEFTDEVVVLVKHQHHVGPGSVQTGGLDDVDGFSGRADRDERRIEGVLGEGAHRVEEIARRVIAEIALEVVDNEIVGDRVNSDAVRRSEEDTS